MALIEVVQLEASGQFKVRFFLQSYLICNKQGNKVILLCCLSVICEEYNFFPWFGLLLELLFGVKKNNIAFDS